MLALLRRRRRLKKMKKKLRMIKRQKHPRNINPKKSRSQRRKRNLRKIRSQRKKRRNNQRFKNLLRQKKKKRNLLQSLRTHQTYFLLPLLISITIKERSSLTRRTLKANLNLYSKLLMLKDGLFGQLNTLELKVKEKCS